MTNSPNDRPDAPAMTDASKEWEENTRLMQKRRRRRKAVKIVLIVLLCLLLLMVTVSLILWYSGKAQWHTPAPDLQITDADAQVNNGKVLYKDVLYEYNPHVLSILCLGVDDDGKKANATYGTNGQSDTLMLVTIDETTGETVVTAIPRDTMTEIDLYTGGNTYSGSQVKQICLAYAYGDGKEVSCERTAKAVSGLLKGIPVNTYVAVDLNTIARINDLVGGVTVTPAEDGSYKIGSKTVTVKAGQSHRLYGENTVRYLRSRGNEVEASLTRMKRQIDYMKALTGQVVATTKKDLTFPVKLYKTIGQKTCNNLNINKVSYLVSVVVGNRKDVNIRFQHLEGTQIAGDDDHAQFLPDEEALMDVIMDLYYRPVNE